MFPLLNVLDAVLPIVYWSAVLIVVLASLCFAVLAWKRPSRSSVIATAGTLAAAVLLVTIPHPAPFPVVTALIAITALAVSVIGGGPAAMLVLAMAAHGSVTDGNHGGILVENPSEPSKDSPQEVLRGGTTIGIFERFASTAAIMAGVPGAIAVVVAIKGVGRFTELDAAEARERFIIGTLVSLVWACACGALSRFTLG